MAKKHSTKKHTDTTHKPEQSKEAASHEEKAAEYLEGWKRAQADYQNLQKQSAREKEELSRYIKAEVLKDFFPIIDHYAMAVAHIPEDARDETWVQGFVHLQKQFEMTLDAMGVTRIETVGKKFDVTCMEAIETAEDADAESDTVVREARAGYMYQNIVIVPAKVIVAA